MNAARKDVVRIGGASGYWGDAFMATPQLLGAEAIDYIVYDYLAEITMSVMARARARDGEAGYATDFVSQTLRRNLREIAARGVKIIANAGGVNVRACAAATRALVAELGLSLRVAAVEGDDLLAQARGFEAGGVREMFSGAPFPAAESVQSINAYIGAFPIARALAAGADIVITGRCVDSALTLGAGIHAFGWGREDWDQLAGASLAGHIIECGVQACGGNFTDWRLIADEMHAFGYPIAELAPDGAFVCTKPAGTGGLVSVGTVSEQLLYEIGDPQSYLLPDVTCDFADVTLTQTGENRVRVAGARGRPAPATYKVCATYADGYRGGRVINFYGREAALKAEAYAKAALRRARDGLAQRNLAEFSETDVEIIGGETQFGAFGDGARAREAVAKVAVRHAAREGVEIALREMTGLGLNAPPGASGFQAGRPSASPVVRLFSFTLARDAVQVSVEIDGERLEEALFAPPCAEAPVPIEAIAAPAPIDPEARVLTPLWALAWARSGDKGDKANVGVIAREAEFLPYISAGLDAETVRARFAHFLRGGVDRFELPGPRALNFLLHDVLGGGGVASLRSDPQGKGYAQLLLEQPIAVPRALAETFHLPILDDA